MTLRPTTEAELAEMIASASGPLSVRGGNTRGMAPEGGTALETCGLSGVRLYEPGALTLVVGAGTPLAEIEEALAAEGQRLAFEPMDYRPLLGGAGTPTIGGVVAANVSGPRRIQGGAARDHMLGLRFVDGRGTVVKNGGRVMKNVTGLDLVRLLTGARGSLGVISEVSLKVLPRPEAVAGLRIDGQDVAQAVATLSRALGAPFEVSGAAYDPQAGAAFLRIEGFAGSVDYRCGQLAALLGDVVIERDAQAVAQTWAAIRDVRAFDGALGDVWRVSCKPSDAPMLVDRMGAEQVLLDWGGGLIWARVPEGCDLRARLGAYDGHATRVRGAGPDALEPEAPAVAALTQGLRARFDPRGLFSVPMDTALQGAL